MANKIFKFILHTVSDTKWAIVKASSQMKAANAVDKPLSHIRESMVVLVEDEAAKYAHLKEGEVVYESTSGVRETSGISNLDLERIAAIGYLNGAHAALQNCDIRGLKLRDRLNQIMSDIKELKGDVSEQLLEKYKGR